MAYFLHSKRRSHIGHGSFRSTNLHHNLQLDIPHSKSNQAGRRRNRSVYTSSSTGSNEIRARTGR